MYDQNGACTTQGCATEKLGTLSWQLAVPPVSRRCRDLTVIRASMSHVLHHTPWQGSRDSLGDASTLEPWSLHVRKLSMIGFFSSTTRTICYHHHYHTSFSRRGHSVEIERTTAFVPAPGNRSAPHSASSVVSKGADHVPGCPNAELPPLHALAERIVPTRPGAPTITRTFEPDGHSQCRLTHR